MLTVILPACAYLCVSSRLPDGAHTLSMRVLSVTWPGLTHGKCSVSFMWQGLTHGMCSLSVPWPILIHGMCSLS